MKRQFRNYVTAMAAWSLMAAAGQALAGKLDFEFDAGDFVAGDVINNPYWPLLPGTSFVYDAESEDGCAVNRVRVTGNTKDDFADPYGAIVAWEVEDLEWLSEECDGDYALMESTIDWYAQDRTGNIWYFGEATTAWDHDDDCPSHAGAWQAGDDGAVAGVVVPRYPMVGTWYQQEFYEGEAEDRAKVLKVDANVSTGFGAFAGCLRTKEFTPLAPGENEHKNYCPGLGLVLINELKGKTVRVELIGFELPDGAFPTEGTCPGPE